MDLMSTITDSVARSFMCRSDQDGGLLKLVSIPYRIVTDTAALKTTVHR